MKNHLCIFEVCKYGQRALAFSILFNHEKLFYYYSARLLTFSYEYLQSTLTRGVRSIWA